MSQSKIHGVMSRWVGTGRYGEARLGSPASSSEIVNGLELMGLIDEAQSKDSIRLSAIGERFLHELHPDCKDADLPARIALWQSEWPQSKEQMTRYLMTFFGKQKRFAAKI